MTSSKDRGKTPGLWQVKAGPGRISQPTTGLQIVIPERFLAGAYFADHKKNLLLQLPAHNSSFPHSQGLRAIHGAKIPLLPTKKPFYLAPKNLAKSFLQATGLQAIHNMPYIILDFF